ncbi:MAG: dual specificity protein phosphatase family protein [Polyangiales bacterium]
MGRLQPSTLRWTALLALVELGLCAQIAWAWSLDLRWVSVALVWPALSLLTVVLLYAGASLGINTGPWMKSSRAAWLQPVLWPYKCVAYALTVLMRAVRGRATAPTQVIDGLWLGMRPFDEEARELEANAVHCIVDLCAELGPIERLRRAPFERLEVPTMDRCPPSDEDIDRAVQWIAERRAQGQRVYVHCAFGRGRSAMLCAAALLRLGAAKDPHEAMVILRRARPSVSVKGDQRRALDAWASKRREPSEGAER